MSKTKLIVFVASIIAFNILAALALFLWPVESSVYDAVPRVEYAATSVTPTTIHTFPAFNTLEVAPQTIPAHDAVPTEKRTGQATMAPFERYTVPVYKAGTVLEVMRAYQTAQRGTFSFSGKEYVGLGFFVETINGRAAGGGKYWILYVNGKSSNLGVSQALVSPGDRIEWRYESNMY